jgi:hypothetical protein
MQATWHEPCNIITSSLQESFQVFKSTCARRLAAQLLIVCLSWPFAMGMALADLRSPARDNTSATSVARIVIKPTGAMAAAPCSFSLTFRMRLK